MSITCRLPKITLIIILTLIILLLLLLVAIPVKASLFGDLNNDSTINILDVVLVMQHILELNSLNSEQKLAGDVNADGLVDVRDVTLIMQKALGLLESFPLKQNLIADFITAEGISPGKELVIVTLDVDEPQEYTVTVGSVYLEYSSTVEGFVGEVSESFAFRDNTAVIKKNFDS